MNFSKKLVLSVVSMMFLFGIAEGQKYNTALGVRLGTGVGVTIQQRIFDNWTIEGIIQSSLRGVNNTVIMAENHRKIAFQKRFNFYYGAGIHFGTDDAAEKDPFGVSAIGGLEATFGRINVSWDYNPRLNITGGSKLLYNQTAISVRYVLIKAPKEGIINNDKKKKKKQKAKAKKKKQKGKMESSVPWKN